MNFMKGSLFHRSTEPEEVEIIEESGGGVLAVWGSPGCGKTVTAVKIAKHLVSQKKNVALLLCDMTAPMMPCICPPSELECDKSLGSIFAAQRISVNLIKHNLTTHKKLSYLTMLGLRKGKTSIPTRPAPSSRRRSSSAACVRLPPMWSSTAPAISPMTSSPPWRSWRLTASSGWPTAT